MRLDKNPDGLIKPVVAYVFRLWIFRYRLTCLTRSFKFSTTYLAVVITILTPEDEAGSYWLLFEVTFTINFKPACLAKAYWGQISKLLGRSLPGILANRFWGPALRTCWTRYCDCCRGMLFDIWNKTPAAPVVIVLWNIIIVGRSWQFQVFGHFNF